MDIGDHIQFTSTGCRGLVVKVTRHEGSLQQPPTPGCCDILRQLSV